jgi:hypothetical protein
MNPISAGFSGREMSNVPDARPVDCQQQVVVRLEVDGARVGRAGDERGRSWARRIANVHDGDPVAERVTDVSIAAMNHDLDAVAPAALVGMADEPDVAGRHGTRLGALT